MQGDWFTHSHNVSIPNHTHSFSTPDHSHTVAIPDHTHNVTIPDHTHTVSIPNHTHTVNIPAHKHDFSIPDHTHEILYGIFEGPQATSLTIAVDGKTYQIIQPIRVMLISFLIYQKIVKVKLKEAFGMKLRLRQMIFQG